MFMVSGLSPKRRRFKAWRALLAVHKFKVGQTVDFSPGRGTMASMSRLYKIVKLLPAEDGQFLYRTKGSSEPFERTAGERDLSIP